ncbi:P-glycoprotein 9 isoform 1 [Hibiscus syriacus]|uniref:p-glycoprotein 9 isoform 1 n=1 Tax=Hibiscus syriacus TaxID=106335 RepID=A0A6A3CN26_HIBSY|nr:uncharacterized protein LOC120189017 [Hibiscus syriacus]KAE8728731.1 P-glycoprotein 9 isoform 1 [Hibiscus syriacus]
MPSGAKKRKAAKKKKEQTANTITSSNNPHGNDDPRSQDERDSDGGDAGSHASQDDYNHRHTFSQGEYEGKRSQSHVTEEKSVEEATKDTESTEKSGSGVVDVKIEKGWELTNDLESTHVSIQHVELDKNSSSSSSSDDESQVSEKKSKEEACNIGSEVASYNIENKSATVLAEDVPKVAEHGAFENGDSNSAGDIVAVDNAVKTALSMPELSETSEKNSVPDVVESGLKANEEKLLPSSNVISGVKLEGAEGKDFPSLDIPTAETNNFAETNQTLEPHEYSEKQPRAASTPPPVQRTSFLSCCGLFEAFTGSGR